VKFGGKLHQLTLMIIIQQYYFMPGHYKRYADALFSDSKHHLVYGSNTNLGMRNAKCVSAYEGRKNSAFHFLMLRLVNSYRCYKASLKLANQALLSGIHIVELEPVTFLLVFLRRVGLVKIVTIHSVRPTKSNSLAFNVLSFVQKKIFVLAIALLNRYSNCSFVVHSRTHFKELKRLVPGLEDDRIAVINYPCEYPNVIRPKAVSKTILIFGLLRADKGIYEFLSDFRKLNLDYSLLVAGKVLDTRILQHSQAANILITDKYLSVEEIRDLFSRADFLVLPYPETYSGGAGPLKDSFSLGTPVCCSKIDLFEEIIEDSDGGFNFGSVEELLHTLDALSAEQYEHMANNAYNYAKINDWASLRHRYEELYC